MRDKKVTKKSIGRTEEEIAAENLKITKDLEERAKQAIWSAVSGMKNRIKTQKDISTGKIELINPAYRIPAVKDDYCTYVYNGKEKTYRKGTQEQVILEHLFRERDSGRDGSLNTKRLRRILENECPLSADKGINSRTVTSARDRINVFFGAKLIESDRKGNYWIVGTLKK